MAGCREGGPMCYIYVPIFVIYVVYMFPYLLYVGVAGCQEGAPGDFAGGGHASSQVRNGIRFNHYHCLLD